MHNILTEIISQITFFESFRYLVLTSQLFYKTVTLINVISCHLLPLFVVTFRPTCIAVVCVCKQTTCAQMHVHVVELMIYAEVSLL